MSEESNAWLKTRLAEAIAQSKAGDLEQAIDTLEVILKREAGHEIALGMLASIYLQTGRHEQAIDHYGKLLESSPENPLARFQLGMALMLSGKPEKALDAWQPLLTRQDEFMAHFHSALALLELGRHNDALELAAIARRNMPQSHPLYPQLIELQSRLENQTALH